MAAMVREHFACIILLNSQNNLVREALLQMGKLRLRNKKPLCLGELASTQSEHSLGTYHAPRPWLKQTDAPTLLGLMFQQFECPHPGFPWERHLPTVLQ